MIPPPLTSAQIRAARALIRWSAEDLARHSPVSVTTIRRAELMPSATALTRPTIRPSATPSNRRRCYSSMLRGAAREYGCGPLTRAGFSTCSKAIKSNSGGCRTDLIPPARVFCSRAPGPPFSLSLNSLPASLSARR